MSASCTPALLRCVLLVWALVLALSSVPAELVQKGASVALAAKWQGTSYMLEAAEMMVRLCDVCTCV